MGSNLINQQMLLSAINFSSGRFYPSLIPPKRAEIPSLTGNSLLRVRRNSTSHFGCKACLAESRKPGPSPKRNPNSNPKLKPRKTRPQKDKAPKVEEDNSEKPFSPLIPKRPRRGRKSEAAAVEDYVRGSLERTFESIREQNPEILKDMEKIMKDKTDPDDCFDGFDDESSDDDSDGDEDEVNDSGEKKMMVEEEDPDWPLDADIGWGIRASEYFDQHPIKNVVSEDGTEIDWEGETDDGLVKEINCLEWESFAFHPSPLIVLVFERYNRSIENWNVLKELEKAAVVYWKAKDRLPPRTVKIDLNIERDLAYALKVKECPQILFLRGNKILYREKEFRSADELVLMIAHFYYNAKKPTFIRDADL